MLQVTNDKRQPGISHLGDQAPLFEAVPFNDVFKREWLSDLHFVAYTVREPEGHLTKDAIPRIKKSALHSIREAGGDVMVTALVLDIDLIDQPGTEDLPHDEQGKPVWTAEMLKQFEAGLFDIDDHLGKLKIARPLVYTTTHGARFVHRLDTPIVAEEAEDTLRGLQQVYRDAGVNPDPACSDWTRLFRAPKVVRDGVPTQTQAWFFLRKSSQKTNPRVIFPIPKGAQFSDQYARVKIVTADKPTPEQAHELLYLAGPKGALKRTTMHKMAEAILRGTDCYGPVFEGRKIAIEGSRDQTLIRLVGQATNFLLGPLGVEYSFTAEDIYALFLAPVEDLEPDVGTPDWTDSLWRKVRSCYEKEQAKLAFQAKTTDEARARVAEEARSILQIVRDTCTLPELHSDDEFEAQTALRRLMLICEPSGRFRALRPDGSYSNIPVSHSRLHSLIRVAKLEDHIPLWAPDSKGEMRPVTEMALARLATDVIQVEGSASIPRTRIEGTTWDSLTLRLRLYGRNEHLQPEFSPEVDEWLELLTSDPRQLRRWLSRALEFEGGPICALSLVGAAGAGKGMLTQGLIETLERPVRADKTVLVGRFNSSLQHTPFLIVDEGLPSGRHDIADTFRTLTAGEPILVEEKFQTPILVQNPMRILFTANNSDVVEQLAAHRMNTAEDQAALAVRLMNLNVQEAASRYLEKQGGLAYTSGWVRGAGGQPTTFKLAKHLLWLYEHREDFGERDSRLLVEGSPESAVIQHMRIGGTVPEAVARAIVTAVENPVATGVRRGIAYEAGHIYITSSAIVEQHQMLQESHVNLTAVSVGRTMRNLLGPGATELKVARRTSVSGDSEMQRWWDVDVKLLWNYAADAGYRRAKLAECMAIQYPDIDLEQE